MSYKQAVLWPYLHGMPATMPLKDFLKMALLNDKDGKPVTFSITFFRRSGKGMQGQRGIEKHCKKVCRRVNPRYPEDGALHNEYTMILNLLNLETGKPFFVDTATIFAVNGTRIIKTA